jgi:response regulator RpfG family c-di-GMP phosphodiesterase
MKNVLAMFVDDDETNVFINQKLIKLSYPGIETINFGNADDAINYLKAEGANVPNMIFLDLNMPSMSGWDFINHYEKIDRAEIAESYLFVLSSSDTKDDQEKARKYEKVNGFLSKPLIAEDINHIMDEFDLMDVKAMA